jgi:hypothetical protein
MKGQKFDIEFISLDSINILNATIENNAGLSTIELSGYETKFQYQLTPTVSIASKKIRIVADYDIRIAKGESQVVDVKSEYKISFTYSIERLPEFAVAGEDNLVTIDEEMLSSLLNITYSTSRGMLYTRYLGTALEGIILPVISTADLLKPSAIKAIPAKR